MEKRKLYDDVKVIIEYYSLFGNVIYIILIMYNWFIKN